MLARSTLCSLVLMTIAGVAVAVETQPIHYWNGNQRVDLDIAVDEYVIEDDLGQRRVAVASKDVRTTNDQAVRLIKEGSARAVRAVFYPRGVNRSPGKERVATGRLCVRTHPGQDLAPLLARHGLRVVETVSYSADTVICEVSDATLTASIDVANRLYEQDRVIFAAPLLRRQLQRRGNPNDPQFANQWHLKNTGQLGSGSGNDINVTSVWDFTGGTGLGTGVNVAVVDDGLETSHVDLIANARTDIDYDFNENDNDPNLAGGNTDDVHGTTVGGVIGARGDNANGTTGVAPRAGLVGVRLIAAPVTDADEGQAMLHRATDPVANNRVHVSNNSWGPSDDGGTLDAPGPLMTASLESGVTNGRGGLGIIYCWAAGNGAPNDVANYDGYANSRFVIAVGASRHDGTKASYSETGTNILVNAPGGDGGGVGMVATDRTGSPGFATGSGDFTTASNGLAGTSFAAPVVAGVAALMLEANPTLTWRDVRHVLVRSATKNDPSGSGWITNGAGRSFNLRYGFGRVNAAAAVAMSGPATWVPAPVAATPLTASETATVAIPENNTTGIVRTRTISGPSDFRVEYVELTVSASHTYRGDLRFQLTSPSGVVSDFQRRVPDDGTSFSNWVFTSVVHWGELANGTWSLRVSDEALQDTGSLTSWSLRIHGYQPHPVASVSGLSLQAIPVGSGNTNLVITGSGFVSGVTRVTSGATTLAHTVDSGTQITATIPASLLGVHGALPVTVVTPSFDGPAATPITRTIQVGSLPQITSVPANQVIAEDTSTAALAVTLADADGDGLTLTASSSNTALIPTTGLVIGGAGLNRTITVTPTPDASGGPVTITLSVSDGISSTTATFTVTVNAVNDKPIALGGAFHTTSTGVALTGNLPGFDPEGATLTYTKLTDPASGTLTITNTATGAFSFMPSAVTGNTLVSFTYKVNDGAQDSDPGTVFIEVQSSPNGTRPLIISEASDEVIDVNGGFVYDVEVDTRRYVIAPTLTFSLIAPPTLMTITPLTSTKARISWTATGSDRHLTFGVMVKDNTVSGGMDVQTIILRVAALGAPN